MSGIRKYVNHGDLMQFEGIIDVEEDFFKEVCKLAGCMQETLKLLCFELCECMYNGD